jgi:hypothetical protein
MRFSILPVFVLFSSLTRAEKTDTLNFDSIRNLEYHLEGLSYNIINGEDQSTRITSCFYFVQTLKKALQIPNSFNYPFSNLKTVSILKPDDERFRIFTWNLLLDSGRYMYFGAIQMNRSDKLELFGLYDSSKFNRNTEYESFDNRHWVGALYYQIHEYKYKGKKHYLLFGWDGEDEFINKKVIDVLWFDENNNPKFGAPVFDYEGAILNRVVFKFSEKTAMLMRYEPKGDIIVFAHLVPVNPMFKGKYEHYVPDGTYDYFKFQKGFWVKQDALFSKKKDYKKVRQPE